jgi:hypothetical protein
MIFPKVWLPADNLHPVKVDPKFSTSLRMPVDHHRHSTSVQVIGFPSDLAHGLQHGDSHMSADHYGCSGVLIFVDMGDRHERIVEKVQYRLTKDPGAAWSVSWIQLHVPFFTKCYQVDMIITTTPWMLHGLPWTFHGNTHTIEVALYGISRVEYFRSICCAEKQAPWLEFIFSLHDRQTIIRGLQILYSLAVPCSGLRASRISSGGECQELVRSMGFPDWAIGWAFKLPCQDSSVEDIWSNRHLEGASNINPNLNSSSTFRLLLPRALFLLSTSDSLLFPI